MNTNIPLKTSDNVVIEAPRDVLSCSRVLSSMLSLASDETDLEPIYLEKISSSIFRKILEWCEHHKGEPVPDVEEEPPEFGADIVIEPWDRNFLNVDQTTLFDLVVAVNFLDIPKLQDQLCKTIASMIKGKSTEEIREIFNIKNDFTREEEELLKRENEWIREFAPQFDMQRNS